MIKQKKQVLRKQFNQQNKRSLGVLTAGDSCCQHSGQCKEALNLDWEMRVEIHMKEKFILQGTQHSLYRVQQVFHALSMWAKLKLQLKLKQFRHYRNGKCLLLALPSVSFLSHASWPHTAPSCLLAEALMLIP